MFKRIFVLLSLCLSVYAAEKPAEIKSVNFIQDGEVSKLIIDFDKNVFAERTHIKDDKQIILDLKNVKSEKKFLRGIDTSEFSGSAVFVSPYLKPGSKDEIRFAIQLRDNVRSFIQNKNNRIVLNIENRFGVFSKRKLEKADTNLDPEVSESDKKLNIPKSNSIQDILENLTMSGVKKYIGKKISINVINVSYAELLRMIADTSGFNIIIDDEVNGLPPLTLSLTNIPWDQALDTILSLGNLVGAKHSNILTIMTSKKAREEKKRELELKNVNKIQEPMVTKIFPLSFATPADILSIIKDYLTGAIIEGAQQGGQQNIEQVGTARVDSRTNNLIVKDTVDVIERVKKIIETLDTETPQILIESKIVEANESYELRAGLAAGGISASYDPIQDGSTIGADQGTFSISSAPSRSTPNIISGSIDIYKRLTGLNFALELMESESKGRVVSSPKIITQNNQSASISTEDVRSFLTTQAAGVGGLATTALNEVRAPLTLNVTPRVTNDGSIAMKLAVSKSTFGLQVAPDQPPPTTSSAIDTNVLVDNGSTIVVGGMYSSSTSTSESGVPFLKDLPLIGWLFKSSYNPNSTKSELIVFITPRVINQEEAGLVNRDTEGLGI